MSQHVFEPPSHLRFQFISPTFITTDMQAMIGYYVEKLGFDLVGDHGRFAIVEREAARVTFLLSDQPVTSPTDHGGCCIYVDDVDAVHEEWRSCGARIEHPPVTRPYGYREFVVIDPCGYRLLVAQHLTGD